MCSRAAPRDALTSTTSAAATFSRTQAIASSRPAVTTASPVQPGTPPRRRRCRARGVPTATTTSTPASAAARPDLVVRASSASAPSSFISPSTATVRRAAAPPDRGQRLDRGGHRRGVGVVGVVDHDQPVGALVQLHPPPRRGLGRATAARPPGPGARPSAIASAAAAAALSDLVGAGLGAAGRRASRRRTRARSWAGRGRRARSPRQVTSPSVAEGEHPGVGPRRHRRGDVVVGVERRRPRRTAAPRRSRPWRRRSPRGTRTRRCGRCRR